MRAASLVLCALLLGGCSGGAQPAPPGSAPATSSTPPATGAAPAAHLAVVTDRSDSIERKDGAACNAVRTMVEHALFRPAGSLFAPGARLHSLSLTPGSSSVEVSATASVDTPRVPAAVYSGVLKRVTISMETPAEVAKRQVENANRAMVEEVGVSCQRTATQQGLSPVYDAVKAAASRLTNLCAAGEAECLLIVQSDLVETVEPTLKKAVDALRKNPAAPLSDSLPTVDLQSHVTVLTCGSGQSSERLSSASREAIRAMWRDRVVVNPRSWVEQDQCPGYVANPVLASGGGP